MSEPPDHGELRTIHSPAVGEVQNGAVERLVLLGLACAALFLWGRPVSVLTTQPNDRLQRLELFVHSYPVQAGALVCVGTLALLGALYAARYSSRARQRPGELTVRDGALLVRRGNVEDRFELSRMLVGWVSPALGRVEVTLRDGGQLSALLSPQDAVLLLDALGLDARHRRYTLPKRNAPLDVLVGLFVALNAYILFDLTQGRWVDAMSGLFLLLWPAIPPLLGVLSARLVVSPPVHIGTDGLLAGDYFRPRFYPYAALAPVERLPLQLRDGAWVSMGGLGFGAVQGAVILQRIREAQALWGAPRVDLRGLGQSLERNGRPVPLWTKEVRALLHEAGFRSASLTPADLSMLLDDVGAPLAQRLAAALVLLELDEPGARERVRAAGDALAESHGRAAFERVLAGTLDEAAVDAAVAASQAPAVTARAA